MVVVGLVFMVLNHMSMPMPSAYLGCCCVGSRRLRLVHQCLMHVERDDSERGRLGLLDMRRKSEMH